MVIIQTRKLTRVNTVFTLMYMLKIFQNIMIMDLAFAKKRINSFDLKERRSVGIQQVIQKGNLFLSDLFKITQF